MLFKTRFIYPFLAIAFLAMTSPVFSQDQAKIKITEDADFRIYKIFFASEYDYDVNLKLIRGLTKEAVVDETIYGKGFVKKFSLKDAVPGKYTWQIKYGSQIYTEEIELLSESQKTVAALTVDVDDLLNLSIEVAAKNQPPISVFLYNGLGEQLKYIFWEPNEDDFKKVIHLSDLDAYDIKVEILQNGDVIFTETYSTY